MKVPACLSQPRKAFFVLLLLCLVVNMGMIFKASSSQHNAVPVTSHSTATQREMYIMPQRTGTHKGLLDTRIETINYDNNSNNGHPKSKDSLSNQDLVDKSIRKDLSDKAAAVAAAPHEIQNDKSTNDNHKVDTSDKNKANIETKPIDYSEPAAAAATDLEEDKRLPTSVDNLCMPCRDAQVGPHFSCVARIERHMAKSKMTLKQALEVVSGEYDGACKACHPKTCKKYALASGVQLSSSTSNYNNKTDTTTVVERKHKLRYDWTNMGLYSPLAKRLAQHQSDCRIPLKDFRYRGTCNGMGSDLHVWIDSLTISIMTHRRMRTFGNWNWAFQDACPPDRVHMACYFLQSEFLCPNDASLPPIGEPVMHYMQVSDDDVERGRKWLNVTRAELYSAGIELLFSRLSPHLISEAERQLNLVFPNGVPPNLITIHIRWGDKKAEMKLQPVASYIGAIQKIVKDKNLPEDNVNVYLATEDPSAVEAFTQAAAKLKWNVFVDHYFHEIRDTRLEDYNNHCRQARLTRGETGLITLASVLVSMEADYYVLTLKSNWSRLMNEIRKNILDPKCQNCTQVINLSPPFTKYW